MYIYTHTAHITSIDIYIYIFYIDLCIEKREEMEGEIKEKER